MQIDHVYYRYASESIVRNPKWTRTLYLRFRLWTPLFVTWHPATFKLRISLVKRVTIGSPIRCNVLSVISVCDSDSAMMEGKSKMWYKNIELPSMKRVRRQQDIDLLQMV
jgi:hypothetical protein